MDASVNAEVKVEPTGVVKQFEVGEIAREETKLEILHLSLFREPPLPE